MPGCICSSQVSFCRCFLCTSAACTRIFLELEAKAVERILGIMSMFTQELLVPAVFKFSRVHRDKHPLH